MVNVLAELAGKHETSVANIAARWVLNHPAVPAVVVGARNANHLSVRVLIFLVFLCDCHIVTYRTTSSCRVWCWMTTTLGASRRCCWRGGVSAGMCTTLSVVTGLWSLDDDFSGKVHK